MKKCMLCGHDSDESVATCPRDGEASWSQSVAKPVVATATAERSEEEAKPEPPVVATSARSNWKGKRR
jgi:hypothetical protein